ncbi:hypothetical protein BSM4216_2155 [Bacillus smithii]|nr:hypothetical protein BSM4216_2155 [Bacillus smithii]
MKYKIHQTRYLFFYKDDPADNHTVKRKRGHRNKTFPRLDLL